MAWMVGLLVVGCASNPVDDTGTDLAEKATQVADDGSIERWIVGGSWATVASARDAGDMSTWLFDLDGAVLEVQVDDVNPANPHTVSLDPADLTWVRRDPGTGQLAPMSASDIPAALVDRDTASICGTRLFVATGRGQVDGRPENVVVGLSAPSPATGPATSCNLAFTNPFSNPGADEDCPATPCKVGFSVLFVSQDVGGTCGYGLLGVCECIILDW